MRSMPMRTVWPDEYLELWGAIYLANPVLRRRRILFETFLQSPSEILVAVSGERCAWFDLAEHLPLLPAQRDVQAREFRADIDASEHEVLADQLVAAIPCTGPRPLRAVNGAIIEPLAHHKHPERRHKRSGFLPAMQP